MKLGISKEDIEFLRELQHEMLTQDHVSQAAPRFWIVQGTVKEYGYDSSYSDGEVIRLDCESYIETMEEAYEWLSEHFEREFSYDKENDGIEYNEDDDWYPLRSLEDVHTFLEINGNDEAEILYYKEVDKNFENTMFLTNRECKEHIKTNHYHYPQDAHSYAMTAWRSREVATLFNILEKIKWNEIEKLVE